MIPNLKNQPSERWKLTTAPGERYAPMSSTFMAELLKTKCFLHDTGCRAVPSMQEIRSTQQCTNNSTLSNQQTHSRTSISNLLRKCGKWKVTFPRPTAYWTRALTGQGEGGGGHSPCPTFAATLSGPKNKPFNDVSPSGSDIPDPRESSPEVTSCAGSCMGSKPDASHSVTRRRFGFFSGPQINFDKTHAIIKISDPGVAQPRVVAGITVKSSVNDLGVLLGDVWMDECHVPVIPKMLARARTVASRSLGTQERACLFASWVAPVANLTVRVYAPTDHVPPPSEKGTQHPVHRLWRENITEYTRVTDSK